jgi:lipopolysaccharide transport protein LptA
MNLKAVRVALVAVCVGLIAAVALTLRRMPPAASTAESASAPKPVSETRQTNLVYRIFKEGRERTTIEAEAMVGHEGDAMRLRGVVATSRYVSEGQEGTVRISSKEAVYNERQERTLFRGNVTVNTTDGLQVETDDLNYRSDDGIARTDGPARYLRDGLSGSSRGVRYEAESGRILMPAKVSFRIEGGAGQPPVLITSRRATALRTHGLVRFQGDVFLEQGRDRLQSQDLALSFDPETRLLTRAVATGRVELQTSGSSVLPGAQPVPGAGGGVRNLRAPRLSLVFRQDRTLEKAVAGGGAVLTLSPGPGQRPERRRIEAGTLTFDFDAQGRAERLRGQRDCRMVAETLGKKPDPRIVTAQKVRARLDPATGEAERIDFSDHVSFERAGERATSGVARYSQGGSLRLQQEPRIQQSGGELRAQTIDILTDTGDVRAYKDVRHLLRGRTGGGAEGLLSAREAPTVVTSARFYYEAARKTAHYEGSALLRSGRDEIRAPQLQLEEDAKGQRRLLGSQGVVSLLHPRAAKASDGEPAAVEGRGASMTYEEGAGRIVYTGDVSIRQGDIVTQSPKATLTLTADGQGLEKLVAGEPVAVEQGARTATGQRGVYTPADETMILTGDNVVLKEGDRQTRGRSLTFKVGDDTILVDGEEEGRTETILRTESPPQ